MVFAVISHGSQPGSAPYFDFSKQVPQEGHPCWGACSAVGDANAGLSTSASGWARDIGWGHADREPLERCPRSGPLWGAGWVKAFS